MNPFIPFNRPSLVGPEMRYIQDAIRRGHLSGDGYYTGRCSDLLERFLGVPKILLTSSCTHALELAFLLLDLRKGDEVIVPSFTFPSTANAFVLRGVRPRFIDIRPDTLNLDETSLDDWITPRTRAVVPVHYAGVPCQMDVIMKIARRRGLSIVEDAAQALGATLGGRFAGTFGTLGTFSFHETKNYSCGEGGAIAVNDPKHIERAEIVRQKGTNRARFYRGEVDKYTWVDVGSSYVPSELQTAYLFAQLSRRKITWSRRKRLHDRYRRSLEPYRAKGQLILPTLPADTVSSYHLFYILLESERDVRRVSEALKRKRILSVPHYFPLHLSAMGKRFGYRKGQLPVTERLAPRLLRLPLYNSMTEAEQRTVIEALKKILEA